MMILDNGLTSIERFGLMKKIASLRAQYESESNSVSRFRVLKEIRVVRSELGATPAQPGPSPEAVPVTNGLPKKNMPLILKDNDSWRIGFLAKSKGNITAVIPTVDAKQGPLGRYSKNYPVIPVDAKEAHYPDSATVNLESLYKALKTGKNVFSSLESAQEFIARHQKEALPEFDKKSVLTGQVADHPEWVESLVDRIVSESDYSDKTAKVVYSDNQAAVIEIGNMYYVTSPKAAARAASIETLTRTAATDAGILVWVKGSDFKTFSIEGDGASIGGDQFISNAARVDNSWPESIRRRLKSAARKAEKGETDTEWQLQDGYTVRQIGGASGFLQIYRPDGAVINGWHEDGYKGVRGYYRSVREAKAALRAGQHEPSAEVLAAIEAEKEARKLRTVADAEKEWLEKAEGLRLSKLVKKWFLIGQKLRMVKLSPAEKLNTALDFWSEIDGLRATLEKMPPARTAQLFDQIWLHGGDPTNEYQQAQGFLKSIQLKLSPDTDNLPEGVSILDAIYDRETALKLLREEAGIVEDEDPPPAGYKWRNGKGRISHKWGLTDQTGNIYGNFHETKAEALAEYSRTEENRRVWAEEAEAEAGRDRELVERINSGSDINSSDLDRLDLKRTARFDYLSPVVQRLFGINKRKVREAMGDALFKSPDTGQTWGHTASALKNASEFVNVTTYKDIEAAAQNVRSGSRSEEIKERFASQYSIPVTALEWEECRVYLKSVNTHSEMTNRLSVDWSKIPDEHPGKAGYRTKNAALLKGSDISFVSPLAGSILDRLSKRDSQLLRDVLAEHGLSEDSAESVFSSARQYRDDRGGSWAKAYQFAGKYISSQGVH